MEGVEDIPGTALAEGIEWEWESFPEYLDALERRRWTVDVGTQVPHGAVRAYVMGERGARNEAATADDIEAMRAIVLEALRAGALGFSTSRTTGHRAIDGELVPGTYAAEDELFGIGAALAEAGAGVFELAPLGSAGEMLAGRVDGGRLDASPLGRDRPTGVLRAAAGRTTTPSCGASSWPRRSTRVPKGPQLFPQIAGRPTGILSGHHATLVPSSRTSRRTSSCGPAARRPTSWPLRWPIPKCEHRSCPGRLPRRPRPKRWRRRTTVRSCSATLLTTSRDRSARWPGWPRRAGCRRSRWPTTRWPPTAVRGCSTSRSSTTRPATSTTCAT